MTYIYIYIYTYIYIDNIAHHYSYSVKYREITDTPI